MRKNVRVYTIGIGNGVSKHLVQGIAQQGRGKYEIVQEESNLEARIQEIVRDSLTPFVDNFAMEYDEKLVAVITPTPSSVQSLRKNEQLNFILFLRGDLAKTVVALDCYDSQQGKT